MYVFIYEKSQNILYTLRSKSVFFFFFPILVSFCLAVFHRKLDYAKHENKLQVSLKKL